MATQKELLRNPGPAITALLPDVQALVQLDNQYVSNEVARLIWLKMLRWGARSADVKSTRNNRNSIRPSLTNEGDDGMLWYQRYPSLTSAIDREFADNVIVKNFAIKLESLSMSASDAWLDFQRFVDLFYGMVDPISAFLEPDCLQSDPCECPPVMCRDAVAGVNSYITRAGLYMRPRTTAGTEGTGFPITNPVIGTPTRLHETIIRFKAPDPTIKPVVSELNNRYFAMNYDVATDSWDVFWYNYDGTGEEPTYTAGAVTYHAIALDPADTMEDVQAKTDTAVEGTTRWVATTIKCYDGPPSDPDRKEIPCPIKASLYVAAAVGARLETEDGAGGYRTVVTTMNASDGTEIATDLDSDLAWQNAHNDLRVPYEKTALGNDVMYLKSVANVVDDADPDGDIPCCDSGDPKSPNPCKACFIFVETPFLGIIAELPVNVPGVINNNGSSYKKLRVTD